MSGCQSLQFLIEAVVLSAAGGVIGILIGLPAGLGISAALGLPLVVSSLAILIAFSVAAIIGIGFGLYPAVRAARLDPIVALRTEYKEVVFCGGRVDGRWPSTRPPQKRTREPRSGEQSQKRIRQGYQTLG